MISFFSSNDPPLHTSWSKQCQLYHATPDFVISGATELAGAEPLTACPDGSADGGGGAVATSMGGERKATGGWGKRER